MKLTIHQVITPAREIKRRVLGGLTLDEVRLYAMKGKIDLKDLEEGIARVKSF